MANEPAEAKKPTKTANYFMKFDGIRGEVDDVIHENQIRLYSWNWCAQNFSSVASGGGSGAGKVSLDDFSFITQFDKSSPTIFKRICQGMHITTGIVSAEKAGSFTLPWLQMTFKGLFITRIQNAANWADEIPSVEVAFSFEQVTIEYRAQKGDGTLISTGPVTYNRMENKLS